MKAFLLFLLLLSATQLQAQTLTLPQIEAHLLQSYRKVLAARFDEQGGVQDSLETHNRAFKKEFAAYTSQYPQTLTHTFDSLQAKNVHIVSSEDQQFRIYSWDDEQGGTMRFFENVFQYRLGDKVQSKSAPKISMEDRENYNYNPFYSQIFTLSTAGKRYYLAVYNGIYSSKDASQSVRVFSLEKGGLNDSVKLFKTKAGLVNAIDVPFDFFSVADRPERHLQLIKYNADKQRLYIPLVTEEGEVTTRFLVYQFAGSYFQYTGIEKEKL